LEKIIPMIEEVLAAGGMEKPAAPEDALLPAIAEPKGIGDAGHRG
jgi:CRISPR-associated protein Cas1